MIERRTFIGAVLGWLAGMRAPVHGIFIPWKHCYPISGTLVFEPMPPEMRQFVFKGCKVTRGPFFPGGTWTSKHAYRITIEKE